MKKKLGIYVFSGTGNTFKCAKIYAKALSEEYEATIIEIKLADIKNSSIPNPNEFDLLGFGYPIYGFNPTWLFVKYLKALPKLDNKIPTFFFKSSGEPLHVNDGSSSKSMRILRRKNYDILSERHIVMPYNMIFRHSDEMAKMMYKYALGYIEEHSQSIKELKHEKLGTNIFNHMVSGIVRIIWPFSHLHGPAFKVDSKKCIKCQKCINNCPCNNIYINKKGVIRFHTNCSLCVRCSFLCPTNAIKIGWLNNWKVNGDYKVEKLLKDESLNDNALELCSKKMYKVYHKYFEKLDTLFEQKHIDLNEMILKYN